MGGENLSFHIISQKIQRTVQGFCQLSQSGQLDIVCALRIKADDRRVWNSGYFRKL